MNIRTAVPEDTELVATLVNDLILELGGAALDMEKAGDACGRVIGDPSKGLVLVAEDRGAAVGVCTLSFQEAIRTLGKYAIIQEMYVATKHRSRGLGAKIIERAVVEAQDRGCKVIELGTPPNGERQESFYRSAGFNPVGARLRRTVGT